MDITTTDIIVGQEEIEQDLENLADASKTLESLLEKYVEHPDRTCWVQEGGGGLTTYSTELANSFIFQACLEKHVDILYRKVLSEWFQGIKSGKIRVDHRDINCKWAKKLIGYALWGWQLPVLCFSNASTHEVIFAQAERIYIGPATSEYIEGCQPFNKRLTAPFFRIDIAPKPISLAEFVRQQGLL